MASAFPKQMGILIFGKALALLASTTLSALVLSVMGWRIGRIDERLTSMD
jgi:hypothetical protein